MTFLNLPLYLSYIRNVPCCPSQTSNSYEYKVDEGELTVHIGSDYWNAIYEEFGTGEHSIKGNGRKGYSLKNYFKNVKAKTDALEIATDDPSSLAPTPKMPSLPKAKTPMILKNLKK